MTPPECPESSPTPAEAAHYDPPYPHELVARVREMAADYKRWSAALCNGNIADRETIGKQYMFGPFDSENEEHLCWGTGHLRAAVNLLRFLKGETE